MLLCDSGALIHFERSEPLGPEPVVTMDGQCTFNALPRVFADGAGCWKAFD
jgi:hypothetical protein